MRIAGFKLFEHRVIGNGPLGPLLERWILFRHPKLFGIFVHKLCRSDHDRALHDHPWSFLTVILRRGYFEVFYDHSQPDWLRERFTQHKPGAVLYRPACHRHRVVIKGKPAWTLVFVGPKCRKWGFWPDSGWCWWRRYDTNKGICSEDILYTGDSD